MGSPLIAVAFVAASALVASPALAYHLVPVATAFSATGTVGLASGSVAFTCTVKITGHTKRKGHGVITGAKLSGSDPHCGSTTASGLPWKMKATGPIVATIANVGFTGAIGACGPGAAGVQVNSGGVWSYDDLLPPSCIVAGSVTTSPAITITP